MTSTEEMRKLLETVEPLDPELAECVIETEGGGRMVKHPLVFSIFHPEQMNAIVNLQLRHKRELLDAAIREGDWDRAVFLHERPHRLEALLAYEHEMSDPDYWRIVGDVWTDSENVWQNEQEWIDAFDQARAGRDHVMDGDDRNREAMAALPERVTVYRGFHRDGRDEGLAWTRDRERAEWFARRLCVDETPRVVTGVVERENVIACFEDRQEAEVVVLPEHVEVESIEAVSQGS